MGSTLPILCPCLLLRVPPGAWAVEHGTFQLAAKLHVMTTRVIVLQLPGVDSLETAFFSHSQLMNTGHFWCGLLDIVSLWSLVVVPRTCTVLLSHVAYTPDIVVDSVAVAVANRSAVLFDFRLRRHAQKRLVVVIVFL